MPTAKPIPGKTLLSPSDHTLIMIDFQSQMAFATRSIDPVMLRNNAALVANTARSFGATGPGQRLTTPPPGSQRRLAAPTGSASSMRRRCSENTPAKPACRHKAASRNATDDEVRT